MIASITVEGQLTGDPVPDTAAEVRGTPVAQLQIAVRDRWRDAEGQWLLTEPVHYHVTVPGPAARHVLASLRAGDRVVVHGEQRISPRLGPTSELVAAYAITAAMIGPSLRYVAAHPERHPDLEPRAEVVRPAFTPRPAARTSA